MATLRVSAGKSAVDAVGRARERCWQYDRAVDLDIPAFFETLDDDLVKRVVRKYTDCRWVLLYVERWLTAPIQRQDGTLTARPAGTDSLASSARCSRISSCIWRSTPGRSRRSPRCRSSGTRTIFSCTVGLRSRRNGSAGGAGAARATQAGGPSEQDEDRILPGSERRASYPETSFEVLSLTFRRRRARDRRGPLQASAGGEPGGGEADPRGHASVVASPMAHRQSRDGPGAHVESRRSVAGLGTSATTTSPRSTGFRHLNLTLGWWAMRK